MPLFAPISWLAASALFLACGGKGPLPDPVVLATSSPSVRLIAATRGVLSFRVERDGAARVRSHRGDGAARATLSIAVATAFSATRYYDAEAADREPVAWHSADTIRSARRDSV